MTTRPESSRKLRQIQFFMSADSSDRPAVTGVAVRPLDTADIPMITDLMAVCPTSVEPAHGPTLRNTALMVAKAGSVRCRGRSWSGSATPGQESWPATRRFRGRAPCVADFHGFWRRGSVPVSQLSDGPTSHAVRNPARHTGIFERTSIPNGSRPIHQPWVRRGAPFSGMPV